MFAAKNAVFVVVCMAGLAGQYASAQGPVEYANLLEPAQDSGQPPAMPGMTMPAPAAPAAGKNSPTSPEPYKKPQATMPEPAMPSSGQQATDQPATNHPGMDQQIPGMQSSDAMAGGMSMDMHSTSLTGEILHHGSSGTTAEPNSTPVPMLMTMKGKWILMFHGVGFLNAIQQSGPRGFDKIFASNWLMPMAQRQWGPGTLTVRGMFSLEPGTVTGRRYPELFQIGETAFGKPIVDGQHPHDFLMELAALYDLKLGDRGLLSFYAAPVGDPAIGPTAFAHRSSASEDPLAVLGHHLQDSTHIAADVVTVGLTYRAVRLEASGFHGREPDEHRWDLDSGKIDSWATRLTLNPAQNWSGQYSVTRLTSPEEINPGEDILRMTASLSYNRPLAEGNWASTVLWGRNRTSDQETFNSYLAESTVRFRTRNFLWGRIENVDRTNELLLGEQVRPPGFREKFLARVQAYTVGYDRDIDLIPHLATALGGQVTFYHAPQFLDPIYGQHPAGAMIFLRLRPFGNER